MPDVPAAIISGASRGIGRFLVERLLAEHYVVTGLSRGPSDLAHPQYTHRTVDVADESGVVGAVRDAARRAGRIDVLVNAAAVASMNHLLLTPSETFDDVHRANVRGAFLMTREVAKQMQRRRSGRIVNFSSIAVALGLDGEAAYASAKGAVEVLTRVAARELAASGIRVNAIAPGPVETGLIAGVPRDRIDALVARQIVRRYATVEDIWNVVRFLLAPESDMISGQVISIGGS